MKQFRFVHASGDTFMRLAKTRSDVGHLLDLTPHPLWVTLTEAGEAETLRAIRAEIHQKNAPYQLINPDQGDIAFLLHRHTHLMRVGGPLAIPAVHKPAREGGHGPRHNSFMKFGWEDEVLFVDGVHLVTYHVDHLHNRGTRADDQVKQMMLLGQQMRQQAEEKALAIGSGDLNGVLPTRRDLQHVFDHFNMTTTAHETGVQTGTHENSRIDYAWTMDKDRRLHVVHMRVLKSGIFHSDHDPIVVDCEIR